MEKQYKASIIDGVKRSRLAQTWEQQRGAFQIVVKRGDENYAIILNAGLTALD